MRPIDADAFKKYIDAQEGRPFIGCTVGEAMKILIDEQPPIQPEPKEGYWIRTDCGLDVECKCSVCGYKDFVSPYDTYWFKRNYCPNCGADMRGEKDG